MCQRFRRGYGVARTVGHAIGEKPIASAPRFLLDVPFADRQRGGVERQPQFCGQRSDEPFVPIRFVAPQPMVDVENGGGQIHFMKRVQQEN